MKLSLKVVPGASRSGIAGWLGESLKIRVTVPAESGKANRAVIKVLADALEIPRSDIDIVSGSANPRKMIEINGLSDAELKAKLESLFV